MPATEKRKGKKSSESEASVNNTIINSSQDDTDDEQVSKIKPKPKVRTGRSSTSPTTRPTNSTAKGLLLRGLIGIGILFIVLFCVDLIIRFRQKHTILMQNTKAPDYELFKNEMDQLKEKFSHQPKKSWQVIQAAVRNILTTGSQSQPIVVLLLATKDADAIKDCIGKGVANAVAKGFHRVNFLTLDGNHYAKFQSQKAKLKIEEEVSQHYNTSHNVVYFKELDKLPVASAMIFHGLCDESNPSFENMVYIFTATITDQSIKNSEPDKFDHLAYEHFESLWQSQLEDDKLFALLTRLFPSVALLYPESHSGVC